MTLGVEPEDLLPWTTDRELSSSLSMIIRCPCCLLRPWRPGDAESLVLHANHPEVARNLRDAFPHPYGPRDAADWIAAAGSSPLDWAIEADGAAIGGIGLVPGVDIGRLSVEIGYWVGRAYWGRGIATAAVCGAVDHAFRDLGLLRVFATPLAGNLASCRVLEKAGFSREGLMRASAVKGGRVLDQALYARLDLDRIA